MNRILPALLLTLALAAPLSAQAPSHHPAGKRAVATGTIHRDRHGVIIRSRAAVHAFEKQTGHPHGWPGHVVDHIKPLACGGADAPSNMQWQTVAAGKAKDKWERAGCVERRAQPRNPMGH